jgi:hexulose-6-phosphate isomerase
MRIGIMQGRLLPQNGPYQCFPVEGWDREFAAASEAGLACIEWIYDVGGASANPIATEEGLREVDRLSRAYQVSVRSVCADYFMDRTFLRCSDAEREERAETLRWLLGRCARLGVGRMVLPFVDQSRIETTEERMAVAALLSAVLPEAERSGVELHLETSLTPPEFERLLETVRHPLLGVTYDSGNSASLGYPVAEEWRRYGARIGSVHIKDRILGGGTVPLGTGNADFDELFSWIRKTRYDGDLILQAARQTPGEELSLARRNRRFVERYLEAA